MLPDIALVDLQMPGVDGIELTRRLRAEFPQARVVILTTYRGDANARDALAAGACGYLLKSSLRRELVDALHRVAQGKRCLSAEISEEIAQHIGEEPLTAREQSILAALAQGWENKRIANDTGISSETVKSHGAHLRGRSVHAPVPKRSISPCVVDWCGWTTSASSSATAAADGAAHAAARTAPCAGGSLCAGTAVRRG